MSSKIHVSDNTVAERRVRPIYDWLDIGNNKKALQECEKVLKKTPNFLCAKALKALALLRMGKTNECYALLDALQAEKPTDDATLQTMTICYRDLQQLDKVCQLYETAIKLDPTNEELHTQLFMSYVRLGDFKAQHQAAMTLYKLKPKNPYYCWAVMSLVLQATRGEGKEDPKRQTILLLLAERMMLKLKAQGKLEAEQEVQLYLMILEYLRKFEEMIAVIDGPLGRCLTSVNLSQIKLPYLMELEDWGRANVTCKGILVNSVDKWDIWKMYIETVFLLMRANRQLNNHTDNHSGGAVGAGGENDLDQPDDTPEKAHEFICRVIENGSDNGYHMRSPYLARFELYSKSTQNEIDANELLGDLMELFIEYFRKFGHKSCCVSDLRVFLGLLDVEKRAELASRLMKDVGISDTTIPETEQQMQRHICALQLSRLCGAQRNLSAEHLRAMVTALSLHYQRGYQTFGRNLLPTELGPADPYALLAAHVLYDLAHMTQSHEPIVAALVLLENMLKNSPSNFHAKLLCVRLYHHIGGAVGAQYWYENLDLKHLQLDSLGYIHCARLPTTGLFHEAAELYDVTLKFFATNYKDSSDHLTFSHKFGTFTKLNEFMDFRERLNNSLHYTMTAVDKIVLGLVQCSSLEALYNLDLAPKDNAINWDELIDNHDLSVYLHWDPERVDFPLEMCDDVEAHFKQDLYFLKLRSCLLYGVTAAIEMAKSTDGRRAEKLGELVKIVAEWDECVDNADVDMIERVRQDLVSLPLPSRLHCHLLSPYHEVIGGLLKVTVCISQDDAKTAEFYAKDIEAKCMCAIAAIRAAVAGCATWWRARETTERLVNATEVFCVASLLCLLCHDLVKPAVVEKRGRRKGEAAIGGGGCVAGGLRDVVVGLVGLLRRCTEELERIVAEWRMVEGGGDEITEALEGLSLEGGGAGVVVGRLVASREGGVKEMQTVLRCKSRLLSGLLG